jgi:hypothetical protein
VTARQTAKVAFWHKVAQKQTLIYLSKFFEYSGVIIMQTDAQHIQCSQKRKKLIENQFSKSKVIDCGRISQKALERLALRETLCFHWWQ